MKIFLTTLLALLLLNNPNNHSLSAREVSTRFPAFQPMHQPTNLPMASSYEQAIEQAKTTNQTIVLLFTGSDWCHWCKVLEQDYISNNAFSQALRGEFLFVRIELPRSQVIEYNRELMKRFNVSGLPTLVVLDANGRVLGRSGYLKMSPQQFAAQLQAMRHTQF